MACQITGNSPACPIVSPGKPKKISKHPVALMAILREYNGHHWIGLTKVQGYRKHLRCHYVIIVFVDQSGQLEVILTRVSLWLKWCGKESLSF